MAKRRFELPGVHELSKAQEKAIRLPMEGCHLIVGGPGTGKTVVTLLRLRRCVQRQQQQTQQRPGSLFLVYNHLLHETARQLFGKDMNSSTWNRWFGKIYREHLKEKLPLSESTARFAPIDWQGVIDAVTKMETGPGDPAAKPLLFIDEGQDMPPQFYEALIRLGFENFYVVADQNQAITSENSTRQQLQDSLDIDPDQVIELTRNFRNLFPVARLAAAFYPNDPATPPLDLPPPSSFDPMPFCITYGPGCRLAFETVMLRVLKLADRDPRKLIGIFTPNHAVRLKYLNEIIKITQSGSFRPDNGAPRVVTYASDQPSRPRFDEGGIFVINAQSCKGLEFDTVFIADINAFHCHPGIQDEKKRLFYVMVARAREHVFLLLEAGRHCPVKAILPDDSTVLKHWR